MFALLFNAHIKGEFLEPQYFQLVSNSLPYCTHIKLIVKVKKGEIVSLEEGYTILKFWSLIINLIELIFPLSIFQVFLALNIHHSVQASTPKYCEKIAQIDLSRPTITIVIWSITTGTKPSRSRSEVSRAKNVFLGRSRSMSRSWACASSSWE